MMRLTPKKYLVGALLALSLLCLAGNVLPHQALAQGADNPGAQQANTNNQLFPNPGTSSTVCGFLVQLLNIVTEIGAIIGVLVLIVVGFYFIWARGKEEQLKTAKRAFLMSILAITLLLGASVLAHILITSVNAVLTAGGNNFTNQSELTCTASS